MLRDRGLRRTSPEMTAESLLRGAHASAVLEGSAPSLDERARGRGRRDRRRRGAALRRAARAGAAAEHARRCRRSPGCTRWRRPGPGARGARAGRATRRRRAAARRRGAAAGRRPRRPALLVAALVHAELATAAPFASHNGIVARAAERLVLVARGCRREVARRTGGGAPGAAAGVRVQPARPTATVGAAGCTPGCSTPPRPSPRAPRPARCADDAVGLRAPARVRTCERHRLAKDRVPPLTRDAWLPSVHFLIVPRADPGDQRPVGRVDRRVGTRLRVSWSSVSFVRRRGDVQGLTFAVVGRVGRVVAAQARRGLAASPALAQTTPPTATDAADREGGEGRLGRGQRHPAAQRDRLVEDQHRPPASRRRPGAARLSGLTACGWPTASSMCTSVTESL